MRQGDPPNGCARLTHAAAKGGKEGGGTHPEAPPQLAIGSQGGGKRGSAGSHRAARTRPKKGPPIPSSARNLRAVRKEEGDRPRANTARNMILEEGWDPRTAAWACFISYKDVMFR